MKETGWIRYLYNVIKANAMKKVGSLGLLPNMITITIKVCGFNSLATFQDVIFYKQYCNVFSSEAL